MAWHSPLQNCPAGFQIIVLYCGGQLLTCKAFKTSTKSYRKFVVCGFSVFLYCLESNVADLKLCPIIKPLALFGCSPLWLSPFPCCQVYVWGRIGEEKGCSRDDLGLLVLGSKSGMAHAGLKRGAGECCCSYCSARLQNCDSVTKQLVLKINV